MGKFVTNFFATLPIVRISQGNYLIGTKRRQVKLKNTDCLVRCGGGYIPLEEFIRKYEGSEMEHLKHMLRKNKEQGKDPSKVFFELLRKCGADEKDMKRLQSQIVQQIEKDLVAGKVREQLKGERASVVK